MKKSPFILTSIIALFFLSCASEKQSSSNEISAYFPVDQELYNKIASMDKEFFDAYNTCDLETQAAFYSNDIEFYHDTGGLMTSKKDIIDGTEKYICGKVTRTLIPGSIEVYPIKDYGAVEIGFHKFYNNEDPDAPSVPSKFIMMWKNNGNDWEITKVISLH